MSKVYFTSDLHFGHKSVIDYCKRPYKDLEEMHKSFIEIWNSTVEEGDLVYVIGDFSLNKKWSREIVPLLKGYKILISGNHDACFKFDPKNDKQHAIDGANRRYNKACEQYLQDGWQSIHQTLRITLRNGVNVLLSHLPYAPKDSETFDRRYINMRPKWEGLPLLHGHLHGRYKKYKNMIDVGIDAHNKILSEDEVIELMNDEREYIESPITNHYKEKDNG